MAARAEIGSIIIKPETFALTPAVEQAVADVDGDFPIHTNGELIVRGDRVRTIQIIRNLATNAHRYGGSQRSAHVGSDDGYAVVEVCDNGAGIPQEEHERVFEPYTRAHDRPGMTVSVGLGLTVSRQLAELMEGTVDYSRERERESERSQHLPPAPGCSQNSETTPNATTAQNLAETMQARHRSPLPQAANELCSHATSGIGDSMTPSTNGPTAASATAQDAEPSTTNDDTPATSTTKHYELSATDSSATSTAAYETASTTTNRPPGPTANNKPNTQLDNYRSWGVSSDPNSPDRRTPTQLTPARRVRPTPPRCRHRPEPQAPPLSAPAPLCGEIIEHGHSDWVNVHTAHGDIMPSRYDTPPGGAPATSNVGAPRWRFTSPDRQSSVVHLVDRVGVRHRPRPPAIQELQPIPRLGSRFTSEPSRTPTQRLPQPPNHVQF